MKRRFLLFLSLTLLVALIGCGRSDAASVGTFPPEEPSEPAEIQASANTEMPSERSLELLKEQCPEYFALSSFKGIEVYVWETEDGAYRCGLMSGTNRMKMDEEIRALEQKSLSIHEAKMILEENGIDIDLYQVIPIVQPYINTSDDGISDTIIIDEERREEIYRLFAD